jgi:hypothetical protein
VSTPIHQPILSFIKAVTTTFAARHLKSKRISLFSSQHAFERIKILIFPSPMLGAKNHERAHASLLLEANMSEMRLNLLPGICAIIELGFAYHRELFLRFTLQPWAMSMRAALRGSKQDIARRRCRHNHLICHIMLMEPGRLMLCRCSLQYSMCASLSAFPLSHAMTERERRSKSSESGGCFPASHLHDFELDGMGFHCVWYDMHLKHQR